MIEVTHICKSYQGIRALDSRELMRVFRDMELVEQLGSGMRRILDAYGRDAFEIDDNFICVTFPFSQEALGLNDDVVGSGMIKETDGRINGRINGRKPSSHTSSPTCLTETERALLNILKTEPSATYDRMAEHLSVSYRTAGRIVASLIDKGCLRRIGSRKSGHWEVTISEGSESNG